jgi:hypothetical protein
MRVLRSWVILVALAIPAGAYAGDHNAEAFAAGSYAYVNGSSDLGGWHVAGALAAKGHKEWSFVGDISAHFFGSDGDKDLTQITLMVGPRYTFFGGRRGMPFVHVMALGAVYRSDGRLQVSNAAGVLAFGGGLDFVPGTHKPTPKSLGIFGNKGVRFQADYIKPIATDMKWSLRLSLGFVYRFHNSHS